jgi:hypothetical protein
MGSRELTPCELLRPQVRLFLLLELDEPASFGPPERISPDGLLPIRAARGRLSWNRSVTEEVVWGWHEQNE